MNRKNRKTLTVASKFACVGLGFLGMSFLAATCAYAASLSLEFHDTDEQAVAQVVAALIPLDKSASANQPAAIMDQRDNQFVPGVLAVRVNTLVHFPNSDDVRHHVYSFSPAKRFELRLYHGKTAEPVLFDQPGQVVLGCNIHDSMLGYIYVVDSEYFGVADEGGKLIIDNIPAGEYLLEIQHPTLNEQAPAAEKISFTTDENQVLRLLLPVVKAKADKDDGKLKKLFKRRY